MLKSNFHELVTYITYSLFSEFFQKNLIRVKIKKKLDHDAEN